jgi:hypothetical protein
VRHTSYHLLLTSYHLPLTDYRTIPDTDLHKRTNPFILESKFARVLALFGLGIIVGFVAIQGQNNSVNNPTS